MIDYSRWSSELAYSVGLIATDGNLSIDGRHIDLTSKDVEQLNNLMSCLDIRPNISLKSSGFSDKKYSRIQFSNVGYYRWLQSIGLTPHKSHSIGKLLIPSEWFFDFLRGSFDGDGCIYSYWDKRWKSSFMFYLVFVSASRTHLDWVNTTINELLGFSGRVNRSGTVYRLAFAKKHSISIIRKMYNNNCICLSRKKEKVEQILRINNTPGW